MHVVEPGMRETLGPITNTTGRKEGREEEMGKEGRREEGKWKRKEEKGRRKGGEMEEREGESSKVNIRLTIIYKIRKLEEFPHDPAIPQLHMYPEELRSVW